MKLYTKADLATLQSMQKRVVNPRARWLEKPKTRPVHRQRALQVSTFYDDLADLLFSFVDEARIERDFQPDVPNADAYPVDYRIDGKGDVPLFLYGVPNRDKARLATIMLSYFHRQALHFESILVFEDQAQIPRMDLARLSDVGGDMISSLASHEDFNRKLLQRVAA